MRSPPASAGASTGYEIEWVLLRRADFVTGVEVVLGRGPTLSGHSMPPWAGSRSVAMR